MKKLLLYLILATSYFLPNFAMQPEDDNSLYGHLRIAGDATSEEIKKAYKMLSFKFHPDRDPSNEEEYKKIAHAYGILSDPRKRIIYDENGEAELSIFSQNIIQEQQQLEELEQQRQTLITKFKKTHNMPDILNEYENLFTKSTTMSSEAMLSKVIEIGLELRTLDNEYQLNKDQSLNNLNNIKKLTLQAMVSNKDKNQESRFLNLLKEQLESINQKIQNQLNPAQKRKISQVNPTIPKYTTEPAKRSKSEDHQHSHSSSDFFDSFISNSEKNMELAINKFYLMAKSFKSVISLCEYHNNKLVHYFINIEQYSEASQVKLLKTITYFFENFKNPFEIQSLKELLQQKNNAFYNLKPQAASILSSLNQKSTDNFAQKKLLMIKHTHCRYIEDCYHNICVIYLNMQDPLIIKCSQSMQIKILDKICKFLNAHSIYSALPIYSKLSNKIRKKIHMLANSLNEQAFLHFTATDIKTISYETSDSTLNNLIEKYKNNIETAQNLYDYFLNTYFMSIHNFPKLYTKKILERFHQLLCILHKRNQFLLIIKIIDYTLIDKNLCKQFMKFKVDYNQLLDFKVSAYDQFIQNANIVMNRNYEIKNINQLWLLIKTNYFFNLGNKQSLAYHSSLKGTKVILDDCYKLAVRCIHETQYDLAQTIITFVIQAQNIGEIKIQSNDICFSRFGILLIQTNNLINLNEQLSKEEDQLDFEGNDFDSFLNDFKSSLSS